MITQTEQPIQVTDRMVEDTNSESGSKCTADTPFFFFFQKVLKISYSNSIGE